MQFNAARKWADVRHMSHGEVDEWTRVARAYVARGKRKARIVPTSPDDLQHYSLDQSMRLATEQQFAEELIESQGYALYCGSYPGALRVYCTTLEGFKAQQALDCAARKDNRRRGN